ncbi:MAG: PilZ domain-containing protein [Terriglobia bacterium]
MERARRVEVSLNVVFRAKESHYFAKTGNLSESGLFVVTRKSIPVDTPLHIVFGMPPLLSRISADGVIRWTKEQEGVGVELTSLTPEQKQAIQTFINSAHN